MTDATDRTTCRDCPKPIDAEQLEPPHDGRCAACSLKQALGMGAAHMAMDDLARRLHIAEHLCDVMGAAQRLLKECGMDQACAYAIACTARELPPSAETEALCAVGSNVPADSVVGRVLLGGIRAHVEDTAHDDADATEYKTRLAHHLRVLGGAIESAGDKFMLAVLDGDGRPKMMAGSPLTPTMLMGVAGMLAEVMRRQPDAEAADG